MHTIVLFRYTTADVKSSVCGAGWLYQTIIFGPVVLLGHIIIIMNASSRETIYAYQSTAKHHAMAT